MITISARNVNDAWVQGYEILESYGELEESRNGDVLVAPWPVTTLYEEPAERVLFDENRDCNPFFHLMEALWMLVGRRDVEFISQFNSRIKEYSDDGKVFHAAYGFRWRRHWGDQILQVIRQLQRNSQDRRCVLQMWDPDIDLGMNGKDFPCNLCVCFRIRQNNLEMTVYNRSNDMIWGAYGANMVHMSILQEYMASMIGVQVGIYEQVSHNFHAYTEVMDKIKKPVFDVCPYELKQVRPSALVQYPASFDMEVERFIKKGAIAGITYENSFLQDTACVMLRAWKMYKLKEINEAVEIAQHIEARDWRLACVEWLLRRKQRKVTSEQ